MSGYDLPPRSPMASRRARRHATGLSNVPAVEGSGDAASTSPSARSSSVTVIHGGRLVRVAPHDRPSDLAARETRVEDRPTLNRVHDKLFKTYKDPFLHKVLRSYCRDASGLIEPDQLRAALERLRLGLDERERERILARVAPASEKVHYTQVLRSLDALHPLGDRDMSEPRRSCLPGPSPAERHGAPAAGHHGGQGGGGGGGGGGSPTRWNWQRHSRKPGIPGLLDEVREGTTEQAQSDALLTHLLSAKLAQQKDKLRIIFRQIDANRDSTIDREEFMKGITRLRLQVPPAQLQRLFDLADVDGNGVIDYEEFVNRFDEHGLGSQAARMGKRLMGGGGATPPDPSSPTAATAAAAGPPPLAQAAGLTLDEVAGALAAPLVSELCRSLYGRGQGAAAAFQRLDLTRCGALGVRDMARGCQALVPGISEREVAAVMAAVDPHSRGHVDYRRFVSALVERHSGEGPGFAPGAMPGPEAPASPARAPPPPATAWGQQPGRQQLRSAPAGSSVMGSGGSAGDGGGGGSPGGALTRWGEPLTVPSLALPPSRSLSATGSTSLPPTLTHGHDSSPRARTAAAPSSPFHPPSGSAPATARSSREELHGVSVAPFLDSLRRQGGVGGGGGGGEGAAVSRSVDLGALARAAAAERQQQQQQQQGGGGEGCGGSGGSAAGRSRAPSHATGRFSRFWDRRYGDTSYLTVPQSDSASYGSTADTWVRKGEQGPGHGRQYLQYQDGDREAKARHREQAAARFAVRSDIDARYSAQDDASGADDGRLAVARAAQQRYEERCEMYDRVRQAADAGGSIFGRLPAFQEHKLEGAGGDGGRVFW